MIKENRRTINVSMSCELASEIKEIAQNKDITMSTLIRMIMMEYVKEQKRQNN